MWHTVGDGTPITLWLTFGSPVAENEVFTAIGWSPLVRSIQPYPAEINGLGPLTAG